MNQLVIDVEEILSEIYNERHWKDTDAKKSEIESSINEGLNRWVRYMIILSNSEQFKDVEKISSEIIDLKGYLNDLFPKVWLIQNKTKK
jgi:hypothetical protein